MSIVVWASLCIYPSCGVMGKLERIRAVAKEFFFFLFETPTKINLGRLLREYLEKLMVTIKYFVRLVRYYFYVSIVIVKYL